MPGKRKAKGKPKRPAKRKGAKSHITGGYHTVVDRTLAGQEDAEYTTMVFETTSAFTNTGGAASYLQIYGNSIYRPYPGVNTSPAGYQRMYTQYLTSTVIEAKCEVMVWGGSTAAIPEPFRIIVLPCQPAQYSIYSAFSNISSLAGVPHAAQAVFSPGAKIPRISARGTNATVLYGESKASEAAELIVTDFGAQTGARPTQVWYFLVGYQNFAGTTTTNQQAQVKLTYRVKWTRPIATAEQSLSLDFFGNEYHREETKNESKDLFFRRSGGAQPSIAKPVEEAAGSVAAGAGERKTIGSSPSVPAKAAFDATPSDFRKEVEELSKNPSSIFASTNVRLDNDYVLVRRAVDPTPTSRGAGSQQ